MKNSAKLPRTAGLRTLSQLTTEMTNAGLDPSRIQERAEMLAKVAGAKRKRERDEDDAGMDVDGDEGMEGGEGEWMDVDEDAVPSKRTKANSGAAIAKAGREPRSNRQFAGMRDDAVGAPVADFVYRADGLLPVIASCEGRQAAELGPERAEHAREGGRVRPRDQNQDGEHPGTTSRPVSVADCGLLYSPNTSSLASGRWARPTAGSLLHLFSFPCFHTGYTPTFPGHHIFSSDACTMRKQILRRSTRTVS